MPLKVHVDEQPVLNLAPMIDIVFLLIIFFMVGTTFTQLDRDIEIQVPEVADNGGLTAPPERKLINVHRDGHITMDRRSVSLEDLADSLENARSQFSGLGVTIRGDGESTWQRVAEVANACRQAGIKDIGMSVQVAAQPAATRR
ncbi:MAG: biopolymer transporter ExbD [Pirellulales bacterium]|nr:biopolymer transporter ExbD [Pirellulales bacterium]